MWLGSGNLNPNSWRGDIGAVNIDATLVISSFCFGVAQRVIRSINTFSSPMTCSMKYLLVDSIRSHPSNLDALWAEIPGFHPFMLKMYTKWFWSVKSLQSADRCFNQLILFHFITFSYASFYAINERFWNPEHIPDRKSRGSCSWSTWDVLISWCVTWMIIANPSITVHRCLWIFSSSHPYLLTRGRILTPVLNFRTHVSSFLSIQHLSGLPFLPISFYAYLWTSRILLLRSLITRRFLEEQRVGIHVHLKEITNCCSSGPRVGVGISLKPWALRGRNVFLLL